MTVNCFPYLGILPTSGRRWRTASCALNSIRAMIVANVDDRSCPRAILVCEIRGDPERIIFGLPVDATRGHGHDRFFAKNRLLWSLSSVR